MGVEETMGQDHAILRRKLALLASAIQVAPEARFVLREMCFSLQRLLQDHIARERQICAAWVPGVPLDSHEPAIRLLRGLNELLLSGMRASVPQVVPRLSRLIDLLTAQMAQQERAVEDAAARALGQAATLWAPAALSGTMSVNEILQRYPHAEPLFAQLCINRLQEGYESVDELAWRHGLDAAQLLERVRQAVAAPVN